MALVLRQAASSSPKNRLSKALDDFEAHLDKNCKVVFEKERRQSQPTLEDVLSFTERLDKENEQRRCKGVGPRLNTILEAVHQFSGVIDTVVGGSQSKLAGLLWGAIKTTLLVMQNSSSYFDKLSDLLMHVGRSCPRFQEYGLLYSTSAKLQLALCGYFTVVVRLCQDAVNFITKSLVAQLSATIFDPFQTGFGQYENELTRHGKAIRDEVRLAGIKEQQLVNTKNESFHRKYLAENRKNKSEKAKRRFLEACSQYDYKPAFLQALGRGQSSWILHTTEYMKWTEPASSIIWCIGKLGSGKTVLTANLVRNILRMASSQRPSAIASYHFCRYDEARSLNVRTIVGSIARQLLLSAPPKAFANLEVDWFSLDSDQIMEIMRKLLPPGTQEYFVVIDELDECDTPESLLVYLKELLTFDRRIHVFCSCRPDTYQRLSPDLEPRYTVSMLNNTELEGYIKTELERRVANGVLRVGDRSIIPKMRDALVQGSQGMFLWVAFQLESICSEETDRGIMEALGLLPKDLPETYDRILGKLQRGKRGAVLREGLLKILSTARRPLKLEEFREALSIDPGKTIWPADSLINDIEGAIPRLCGSLVIVAEGEGTVHFAHHSVKQHLLSHAQGRAGLLRIDSSQADSYLGDICVTYLNLNVFETQIFKVQTRKPLVVTNISNTIARNSYSTTVQNLAWAFSKVKGLSQRDSWVDLHITPTSSSTPFRYEYAFLDYAAWFWLDHIEGFRHATNTETYELFHRLVRDQVSISKPPWELTLDHEGGLKPVPRLCWAVSRERVDLVEALLNMNEVDVNLQDSDGNPALSFAACSGQDAVARPLLLAGADAGLPNAKGWTPLIQAARYGHESTVRLLLDHVKYDAKVIAHRDWYDWTVLHHAAAAGHEGVVKLLLGLDGACIDAADKSGMTPLASAAKNGHGGVCSLLLARGAAGMDQRDRQYSRTPLSWAAVSGHEKVVAILLEQDGADPWSKDIDCRMPMSHAMEQGHKGVEELLRAFRAAGGSRRASQRTKNQGLAIGQTMTFLRKPLATRQNSHDR
ncbi:hypothetical protein EDD37DRAFT_648738 [Exophiala viscosa]|uniref:uncharacterized protein n=1 Tax=Exophiala viscosa TaxID=2486360 RepID=UPI0021A1BAF5|nr:hypothetical protein EDD37DRAFT_648738 [Exophiala viscosa]